MTTAKKLTRAGAFASANGYPVEKHHRRDSSDGDMNREDEPQANRQAQDEPREDEPPSGKSIGRQRRFVPHVYHSPEVKEKVLKLRRTTDMSLREIAAATSVKLATVGHWCKGKTRHND